MFDTSQLIGLNGLYINIKLRKANNKNQKEPTRLNQNFTNGNFINANAESFSEECLSEIEAVGKYRKIIILGESNSGKTTFLRYLAYQNNQGKFKINLISIFITLKDFILQSKFKPGDKTHQYLIGYIQNKLSGCGVTDLQIKKLLNTGRMLILIDDIDQIEEDYRNQILEDIYKFSSQFANNYVVIACRKTAWKYVFKELTEIEIENYIVPLLKEIKDKLRIGIEERCGTMRVLDMTHPLRLGDIYTNVNILEKITGTRRLNITQLMKGLDLENFDRFGLSKITENRVPGKEAVERYSKLMILGKPGAGKTTFLKYLAMQCSSDEFLENKVSIFITLKDFAEAHNQPNLFAYIKQQFEVCRIEHGKEKLEQILSKGRALLLLDGLDEVREEDSSRILKDIRLFSTQYHSNHFVMTCRIAAREYTFEKFIEVEVADFNGEQISTFAYNWFKEDLLKARKFIEKLEQNSPIKELASNPLLLTLQPIPGL